MDEVIAFRPRDEAARERAQEGSAQILFFTGARYRRDDPDADLSAPRRPFPRENRGRRRRN
jgi:hypothetical protein